MSKIGQLVCIFLLTGASFGQGSLLRVQKFCEIGNQSVITQGLNSVTKVQRSFPQCTVTVYQSGTTSLATIYSNNLAIPTVLANPFTANVDGSWGFYANPGACYDVVNSGAGFPAPFTYSYICLNSGGGASAPCQNTVINGAIGASNGAGGFACDNSFTTDFAGNFTAQSGTFRGPVNGFYTYIGGGLAPGTNPVYKLPANAVRFVAPLTVGTSFYVVPPNTRCTAGQVWGLASETVDANGDPVDTYQCQNNSSGGSGTPINSFDQCSPAETVNPGNVAWTVTNFGGTVWDAGHWEFLNPTSGGADLYCSIRIPPTISGSTIILDFFSSDTTPGDVSTFQTCDATTTSQNLNVGSLTCAATQNYAPTSTAYSMTELVFTPQSFLVANQYLIVKIHKAAGNAGNPNVMMEPPKFKAF